MTRKCAVCGAPLQAPKTGRPPATCPEHRKAHAANRARRRRRKRAGFSSYWRAEPLPTGGRDPVAKRAARLWLRKHAPTAERTLSPEGWQALGEVLQGNPEARLYVLSGTAQDPYLRISGARWRALCAELEEAIIAGWQDKAEATKAEQAEAEAELLARTRALLADWELPEATTTRELFDAIFTGMDTNRAKTEHRALARATHPDQGGDQQVFGVVAAAYEAYRERMLS